MRKLPADPADWTDDDIAFARRWDPQFRVQVEQALAGRALENETPDSNISYPPSDVETFSAGPNADYEVVDLPWMRGSDAGESADDYDRMKLAELKAEAESRGLALSEGADGRKKDPWVALLRADDADYAPQGEIDGEA